MNKYNFLLSIFTLVSLSNGLLATIKRTEQETRDKTFMTFLFINTEKEIIIDGKELTALRKGTGHNEIDFVADLKGGDRIWVKKFSDGSFDGKFIPPRRKPSLSKEEIERYFDLLNGIWEELSRSVKK